MSCWTFLLPLHLAACMPLPPPSNVSITSFNMEHMLHFQPGVGTPASSRFAVQTYRGRRWWPVASCQQLAAGQTCNLSLDLQDPLQDQRVRVRAMDHHHNHTSSWSLTPWFHPLTHTVLGPPDVTLSGCGNCLHLQLRVPTARWRQQLMDLYRELVLTVRRSRDGAKFEVILPFKEEAVLSYLQPGVEYCVTTAVRTPFGGRSLTSQPHCAFTSPAPPSALRLVYVLAATCGALGPLLAILLLCGSQPGIRLLKRHLLRTMSFARQCCQSGGAAVAAPDPTTSTTQRNKESAE
ncbi:interferon alpha/beta receptor 2-like [Nelusetta ayraudi]|uniref:interferon alpha/beta receptor 2-like n=1 Tax=Nelusetta ayraudi TaxID=303726 RepID=UPI003F703D7E